LDEQERVNNLVQAGLFEYYAQYKSSIEAEASDGFESALNSVVEDVTGSSPTSFGTFITKNKAMWIS
jgi:hypothetical protein